LADTVEHRLRRRAREDDLEQAVYGFDAKDELALHPLIREAFVDAGFGAWPEQRYPGDEHRSKKSEGKRCDLVLTPAPGALPLADRELQGTLFAQGPACPLEHAYWLEIKTVAQHETGGPFARYAAELLQPVTQDVKKLWSDPSIRFAGLLILLFTADQTTAQHDLNVWHERCLARGFPVAPAAIRFLPITERIGNACCACALFGVRGA